MFSSILVWHRAHGESERIPWPPRPRPTNTLSPGRWFSREREICENVAERSRSAGECPCGCSSCRWSSVGNSRVPCARRLSTPSGSRTGFLFTSRPPRRYAFRSPHPVHRCSDIWFFSMLARPCPLSVSLSLSPFLSLSFSRCVSTARLDSRFARVCVKAATLDFRFLQNYLLFQLKLFSLLRYYFVSILAKYWNLAIGMDVKAIFVFDRVKCGENMLN